MLFKTGFSQEEVQTAYMGSQFTPAPRDGVDAKRSLLSFFPFSLPSFLDLHALSRKSKHHQTAQSPAVPLTTCPSCEMSHFKHDGSQDFPLPPQQTKIYIHNILSNREKLSTEGYNLSCVYRFSHF